MLAKALYTRLKHISAKHLHRYVAEFAGCHNVRDFDTIDEMAFVVIGVVEKRLMYSGSIRS